MNILDRIDQEQMRFDMPEFRPGDTVKVHIRIIEGNKERVQVFQGVVIKRKRGTMNATFTVRKISHGVGVEKTFALHSPRIEKVEMVTPGRVRRSRLFYLRERRGKAARIRERGIL
ncbi:MAG: 50S ribosomal protein L19 [Desulfobulbus sp.]|uniref:50S ribosomal protein L19 n=1 Tax=uncultured Desulfobulbus sp. TaxID=239745 RepID=UPI001B774600|nr:50S ribosomal protein L19 [uncultured Desulfobulbus sp.]MBP7517894.1 50S ribosomal protein L19 [Desulfobulbus sp.]